MPADMAGIRLLVYDRHGSLLRRRYDFVKSAQPGPGSITAECDKDGNEPERRQPILHRWPCRLERWSLSSDPDFVGRLRYPHLQTSQLASMTPLSVRNLAVGIAIAIAPSLGLAQATPPVVVTPAFDFSGVIFGSYSLKTDSASKANLGGKAPNLFGLDRAYLTFRMPAGDNGAIRITTDIFQNTNPAQNAYYAGLGGPHQVRLPAIHGRSQLDGRRLERRRPPRHSAHGDDRPRGDILAALPAADGHREERFLLVVRRRHRRAVARSATSGARSTRRSPTAAATPRTTIPARPASR